MCTTKPGPPHPIFFLKDVCHATPRLTDTTYCAVCSSADSREHNWPIQLLARLWQIAMLWVSGDVGCAKTMNHRVTDPTKHTIVLSCLFLILSQTSREFLSHGALRVIRSHRAQLALDASDAASNAANDIFEAFAREACTNWATRGALKNSLRKHLFLKDVAAVKYVSQMLIKHSSNVMQLWRLYVVPQQMRKISRKWKMNAVACNQLSET